MSVLLNKKNYYHRLFVKEYQGQNYIFKTLAINK